MSQLTLFGSILLLASLVAIAISYCYTFIAAEQEDEEPPVDILPTTVLKLLTLIALVVFGCVAIVYKGEHED